MPPKPTVPISVNLPSDPMNLPRPSLLARWESQSRRAKFLRGGGILLLIFILMGGVGFAIALLTKKNPSSDLLSGYKDKGSPLNIFSDINNTEQLVESPINGLLYSPQEALTWQGRRPIAVMMNNHVTARQVQVGLSQADLIYEAVAEGGISRFLAIYHSKLPSKVGTIRSARVYYIDWAKEYNAWYAHHGRAQIDPNNPAVCDPRADTFSHMQSIFVSSVEGVASCWRENNGLAYEHTLFCDPSGLLNEAYQLYPDQPKEFNQSLLAVWKFKNDQPVPSASAISTISFDFWDTTKGYEVEWKYQSDTNTYKRKQGGQAHIDHGNSQQLEAKTVIVVLMKETSLNDLKAHLLYQTLGQGEARIFMDGKAIKASWSRDTINDRTEFYDASGVQLKFNRGQVWIEVVPMGNSVTYI
ncbi:hypothetical protein COX24_00280 [bacterium (Candidatus Gribaldobacteria) CG23_combo_of_CG06-09_8_20_14_all_37_87_8]|uniref:DUF3048 domain-containing protein n=2 Tax=Bacteria candidate phyla TaxID=1783234 RepID=A0A2H0X7W5_UNCKA|nr:MAG: hypothetical protein COX24_00280 [bacterium (Candidatus Gribaldobacteria) CG23_combo_of_CG06-09_8_20_14_all_37_87_8]PIS21004.1 MAG: hypothetical protein COT52_00860 [candidate division WWE3 bacterium CG08_land_8_20_14_0_20_43_13]